MSDSPKKRVMIVEDDYFLRYLFQEEAYKNGYDVVVAQTGEEALVKLRAEAVDLVLLDIMLSHVDGLMVLRTIKADEQLRHIPCVMFTNLDDNEKREEALGLGADAYLLKIDHTPAELFEKIRKILPNIQS